MATRLRHTVGIMSPFIYAAGLVLVMIGDIILVSFVERIIGFYDRDGDPLKLITLNYNGDVIGAVATLVIGGLVFGLLASAFVRLEGLRRPTFQDHLRHCAALYVILGTLVALLLVTYENQAAHGASLGYGVAVVTPFVAGYAIVIDGLVLWRRRYVQVSSGNIT